MNFWINLYKPQHKTSNDVLSILKRHFKIKKMGHAGTLDKLACGILPVAIGEATKTVSFIMDHEKEYYFSILFGESRTTDDFDGEIVERSTNIPTTQDILKNLPLFLGKIQQTPPLYSAIKIQGKRASDLVRSGIDVDLSSRIIEIFEFELLSQINEREFSFRVRCSKGTYIRSLARDLAQILQTVGCISFLERSKVGAFEKKNSISVESLLETSYIDESCFGIYSIKTVLDDIPAVLVGTEEAEKLLHGISIKTDEGSYGNVLCLEGNKPIGIGFSENGIIRPVRNFNLN